MQNPQKKYVRLSHNISTKTTANAAPYNTPAVKITPVERFDKGDTADTSLVEFFNHCGTHMDLPGHKIPGGKSITDYTVDEFIFERPYIIDVALSDEENLSIDPLEQHSEELAKCDVLLLRSNFAEYRSTDLQRYVWKTPGVAVETAEWLVRNFPNIKAVGMNFLSFEILDASSHQSRGHRALLSRDVKIIEDMNLEGLSNDTIGRIFVMPMFVEEIDSFHVTIVAETR